MAVRIRYFSTISINYLILSNLILSYHLTITIVSFKEHIYVYVYIYIHIHIVTTTETCILKDS